MIRWELYKLVRQRRTLFGLGAMALVPVLFVAALEITRQGPPEGDAPFATQLLEQDTDIRVIHVLLGHAKLDTTALYTRVANTTIRAVISPLDRLAPPFEEEPRPEG